MGVNAFVDIGHDNPHSFCIHLLQSPDFNIEILKKFNAYGSSKQEIAVNVAERIRDGKINLKDLMLEYCKHQRQWFCYKIGNCNKLPRLKNAEVLLTRFGKEKWYGPIKDSHTESYFYLRIYSFRNYSSIGSGETKEIVENRIRWVIIANVHKSYITLYWNGFTQNSKDRIENRSQFPFWLYIPEAIDEIESTLKVEYNSPIFHKLILDKMWNKYLPNSEYNWNHLAVRAESSGVALNARSAAVQEIDVRGLLALANKLAESIIDNIDGLKTLARKRPSGKKGLVPKIERTILRTLIHEWGTKSYEFSLERGKEKLFRAHCYFGLKPDSNTQDRFPHFKSYRPFGGNFQALEFLLNEEG